MQKVKNKWPEMCEKINAILDQKKITKYQLSKLSGIAEPNIRRMLNPGSNIIPSISSIIRICDASGILINFDGQTL